jgi:hypothetical protein
VLDAQTIPNLSLIHNNNRELPMIRKSLRPTLILAICIAMFQIPARPQANLQKIGMEYQTVSTQLKKHLAGDDLAGEAWIDNDPRSPELLARKWSLAGQWVAAWLDAHPSANPDNLKSALAELAPTETANYLELNETAFLVAAPGPIGNAFIVAKSDGHYRLAWSTADSPQPSDRQSAILSAWRADHAQHGGRGPYLAVSGSTGSIVYPDFGTLPADAQGHKRFYIDGLYAQSAGGTVGAQTSLWVWDGNMAHPLIARDYAYMIDQKVRTRLEGDLLRVQQKKFFRTFSSCGECEERQTDWIVRITSQGVEDQGEVSLVPELDAVDELFSRLIHGRSAARLATPAALKVARDIVNGKHAEESTKEWKEFPSLGMMSDWTIVKGRDDEVLCFATDGIGAYLFTLKNSGNGLFITNIKASGDECKK